LARLRSTGFDERAVVRALEALPFVELQPGSEQVPFKVSYFAADNETNRARVAAALAALPFRVEVVWSHDYYLDVAPYNGAKGGAVGHLIETWKLTAEAVVAAGDSGNDANMLDRHWLGIVVK